MLVFRQWPIRQSDRAQAAYTAAWEPAADVLVAGGVVEIRVELAAVPRESIEVLCEGWRLIVRGQRPRDSACAAEYRQAEINYGQFQRVFEEFPFPLDEAEVTARLADGLLTVTVAPRGLARRRVLVDPEP